MDLAQLAKAIEKQAKLDAPTAQRAVEAMIETLRHSPESRMIIQKVPGKSASPEDRRTIHLCG